MTIEPSNSLWARARASRVAKWALAAALALTPVAAYAADSLRSGCECGSECECSNGCECDR
jgi:hypothetical protein